MEKDKTVLVSIVAKARLLLQLLLTVVAPMLFVLLKFVDLCKYLLLFKSSFRARETSDDVTVTSLCESVGVLTIGFDLLFCKSFLRNAKGEICLV